MTPNDTGGRTRPHPFAGLFGTRFRLTLVALLALALQLATTGPGVTASRYRSCGYSRRQSATRQESLVQAAPAAGMYLFEYLHTPPGQTCHFAQFVDQAWPFDRQTTSPCFSYLAKYLETRVVAIKVHKGAAPLPRPSPRCNQRGEHAGPSYPAVTWMTQWAEK